MSRQVSTILDDLFPDDSPEFEAIADAWPKYVIFEMLTLVWDAFDNVKALPKFMSLDFSKGYAQLERSLTDLHASEVTLLYARRFNGFESFIPQYEPWEFENLSERSARPPSGDIGFVLRENRRLRWSVEAKVVNSSTDIARYLGDLDKYLEGKGAPLATEAALGAYLINGKAEDLLASLETAMKTVFKRPPVFSLRPHGTSDHRRDKSKLPVSTPAEFLCHHLVFCLN
jgi:hypothetical protein